MEALHQQASPSPINSPQFPNSSRSTIVSASALASSEKRRRDLVRSLGPCPSGCKDLDEYVLMGGFERGSVAGISAEEEDGVGVTLGLQVLICSLLDNAVQKVQLVTPKPPSTIVVLLKNGITAELRARGVTASDEVAARGRDCLDRIMLSRVFDMDGLCEVLADLDDAAAPGAEERILGTPEVDDARVAQEKTAESETEVVTAPGGVDKECKAPSIGAEIQDSQDEDEALSPSQPLETPAQPKASSDEEQKNETATSDKESKPSAAGIKNTAANSHVSAAATPDIILITHFSSLLTSFFTQRDNSAAHATLRLLASRLRRLSRTLPSSPLILLINSTDSGAAASTPAAAHHPPASQSYEIPPPEQQPAAQKPSVDPTLRSIFSPASASPGHAGGYKPNKPTFGLVFTQLLDIHLLCTRAPRSGKTALPRSLTVVEVLLDDIGLWEGKGGLRKRREQRWTVVAPSNGRIIEASDGKRLLGKE
ncbi:hypothetical protein V8C35DRAFT_311300 [Trichoderma chlorosporum]